LEVVSYAGQSALEREAQELEGSHAS
jgi:hypothetical protein